MSFLFGGFELDGERHGPMAARLVEAVCGDDADAWHQALLGGRDALRARHEFWDLVALAVSASDPAPAASSVATC